MAIQSVYPDLRKLVEAEDWSVVTDVNAVNSKQKLANELIFPDNAMAIKQEKGYTLSCEKLDELFHNRKFPLLFNKQYFVSVCQRSIFQGEKCSSVGQFMRVIGEGFCTKDAKSGKASEPAINICHYLAMASPANGQQLLIFLYDTTLYDDENIRERLKMVKTLMPEQFAVRNVEAVTHDNDLSRQFSASASISPQLPVSTAATTASLKTKTYTAEQYKTAILACKGEIEDSIDVGSLWSNMLSKGILNSQDSETLLNTYCAPFQKQQYLFRRISEWPASNVKLFYDALKEEGEHIGHDTVVKIIDEKLSSTK